MCRPLARTTVTLTDSVRVICSQFEGLYFRFILLKHLFSLVFKRLLDIFQPDGSQATTGDVIEAL